MYLDTEGFKNDLLAAVDCTFDDEFSEVERLISKEPEEKRERLREEFLLDERIMRARTYGEVKDISLEQILNCIGSYSLFFRLYERTKAAEYFTRFSRIEKVRTCRKRRIL